MATGTWSDWSELSAADSSPDPRSAEAAPARGATEPLWTGPSNGVELRVTSDSGTTRLPAGLRLEFVASGDLGSSADSSASGAAAAAEAGTGAVTLPDAQPAAAVLSDASPDIPAPPTSTMPKPAIVTRAQWGADETLRDQTLPSYSPNGVKVVFVHHTANSNDYRCSTDPADPSGSAAVVQADYAYHVKANGWRDLGYNFLVDKCGTIFEGRWGGLDDGHGPDLPVVGAHTLGVNTDSMGVAVLGTYTDVKAPAVVLTSLAALADWKLGMYGLTATGKSTLVEGADPTTSAGKGVKFPLGTKVDFNTISGHRDAFATECPGNALYPQLADIRSYAAGPAAAPVVTGLTGATKSGTTWYTTGKATVSWSESWPSGLISRFEVLVDGKTAATIVNTARSGAISLAPGTHTVAVRAVHIAQSTSTSAATTVIAETTKPVFSTAPAMQLRTGTVSTGAVPVTLTWKATDNKLLKSVALTSPAAKTFGPTVTSYATTAKSGVSTSWALKATDMAGNSATASVARTPAISQETAAAKTGTWTKRTNSSYLGGASYSSKAKNASLTWTFTGRSVAWVVSRASDSGQAYIYLDGKKVATYDLKSSKVLYRQAVWTKNWSTSATHKLKIVVVATSGRPTITTDGIVVLK
ncbi:peptidoglycan recognition protein family protein [Peterkaempfera bronchialis]|nr:peptidoglycan recognition protein [Peterkaempfera bronchialis]